MSCVSLQIASLLAWMSSACVKLSHKLTETPLHAKCCNCSSACCDSEQHMGALLVKIEKLMDRVDAHPLIRTWSMPPTPLKNQKINEP